MIDLRRRTTYFFLLVSLGHVLLISAQVQSKSGTPVLTHLTFGAFAGGQRAAAWATDGVGGISRDGARLVVPALGPQRRLRAHAGGVEPEGAGGSRKLSNSYNAIFHISRCNHHQIS